MNEKLTDQRIKRLGGAIRTARVEQGLSQEQLSYMIGNGNGQSYIARIESGNVAIGIDVLIRIAEALGLEPSELLR